MTEVKLGLLDNFAINNWYKFLLYVGGVILILSMFLEPKGITIMQLRTFSINTIILSLIVWIVSNRFNVYINNMDESEFKYHGGSQLIIFYYLIVIVALSYWIFIIVPIIPYS